MTRAGLQRLAAITHGAFSGFVQSGAEPAQRAFAATRLADQRHHVTRVDRHVDPIDRMDHRRGHLGTQLGRNTLDHVEPTFEALADAIELKQHLTHGANSLRELLE